MRYVLLAGRSAAENSSLHLDNFNPVRSAKDRPFLQLGINNKWVVKRPR